MIDLPHPQRWMQPYDVNQVCRLRMTCRGADTPVRLKGHLTVVYPVGSELVAYAQFRDNGAALCLADIGVAPEYRMQRIATQLVGPMIHVARLAQRYCVFADVPENNVVAQIFLRKLKFRCTTTHHTDGGDLYRFIYPVTNPGPPQGMPITSLDDLEKLT